VKNVTAYTVGGAITSVAIGAALGLAGSFVPGSGGTAAIAVVLALTAAAIVREVWLRRIPLPQLKRQTSRKWAQQASGPVVPLLWGLDIGLTFSTFFTFAGVWVVLAIAFLFGDPGYGAVLLGAYWLGRALSVWVAPLLLERPNAIDALLDGFGGTRRLVRGAHVAALLFALAVLAHEVAGRAGL
jgi:hypothetical protein